MNIKRLLFALKWTLSIKVLDKKSDAYLWRHLSGGSPPRDRTKLVYELMSVSLPLFIFMAVLTSLAILISLFFLWFNITKRNVRYDVMPVIIWTRNYFVVVFFKRRETLLHSQLQVVKSCRSRIKNTNVCFTVWRLKRFSHRSFPKGSLTSETETNWTITPPGRTWFISTRDRRDHFKVLGLKTLAKTSKN